MNHISEIFPESLCIPDGGPDREHEQRAIEAREIRDRLPLVLRKPTRQELEGWILERANRSPQPKRTRALGVARQLIEVAGSWKWGDSNVLLMGPTRVGKSTAAGILFRRLLGEGVKWGDGSSESPKARQDAWQRARFMRWFGAEELSLCRKAHPLGHGDPPRLIEACNARLLFLDDAGWETDVSVVSEVLAERCERGWPTVITTGRNRQELTDKYGAAVVARAREAGGVKATEVDCFEEAQP